MRFLLAASILALAGCGYVGDPKPPALNIPLPVDDLAAAQRGDVLRITFTLPPKTIEGLPIRSFTEIDVRVGPAAPGDFNAEAWLATAQQVPVSLPQPAPTVMVEAPVGVFAGKEIICAVRTAGPKGRMSALSNLVLSTIVPPLGTPSALKGDATSEGVRLTWTDPHSRSGVTYRISRQSEKDKELVAYADSTGTEFVDKQITFGTKYQYQVQGILKSVEHEVESMPSSVFEIVPIDRFAPAVPVGVNALAGVSTIELSWDRNTESDFRGYNVFRSVGDGEFVKAGGPIESPAFSDRMIEPGKTYRYAISAIDTAGNESNRSQPVQITAPQ